MCGLALATICVLWAPIDLFDAACYRIYMQSKGETPPPDNQKLLGLWLKEHVSPADPIYIWTRDAGSIYAYAERTAPSRFFHNHFAGNADAMAEVRAVLDRRPPQYVVVEQKPYPAIPAWLQEWIDRNYVPHGEVAAYIIYRRSSGGGRTNEKP